MKKIFISLSIFIILFFCSLLNSHIKPSPDQQLFRYLNLFKNPNLYTYESKQVYDYYDQNLLDTFKIMKEEKAKLLKEFWGRKYLVAKGKMIKTQMIQLLYPLDGFTVGDIESGSDTILIFKWKWHDPGGSYSRTVYLKPKYPGYPKLPPATSSALYDPLKVTFHLILSFSGDNSICYEDSTKDYTYENGSLYSSKKYSLKNLPYHGNYNWGISLTIDGVPKEYSGINSFTYPAPPILTMKYNNPQIPDFTNSYYHPDWAKNFCNKNTLLSGEDPRFEWMPVLDNGKEDGSCVGISGYAVNPKISGNDMPFTHPFGFDWEFFIVPDERFEWILAPNNFDNGPNVDGEFRDAIDTAKKELGMPIKGVLGVETDSNLVPGDYRVKFGDRVAVLGRWIVDAGHDDFHTEIHPPLLIVHASKWNNDATVSRFISNPYLVSQIMKEGYLWEGEDPLFKHFEKELTFASFSLIPYQIKADPKIIIPSFSQQYTVKITLRPPSNRMFKNDKLKVSYWFVTRSTVRILFEYTSLEAITVIINMDPTNDENNQANLPRSISRHISKEELTAGYNKDLIPLVEAITNSLLLGFASLDIIAGGIETTSYEATSYYFADWNAFYLDKSNNNPSQPQIIVDNDQPFPIYGNLDIQWERH